jgi:hypothetical protein
MSRSLLLLSKIGPRPPSSTFQGKNLLAGACKNCKFWISRQIFPAILATVNERKKYQDIWWNLKFINYLGKRAILTFKNYVWKNYFDWVDDQWKLAKQKYLSNFFCDDSTQSEYVYIFSKIVLINFNLEYCSRMASWFKTHYYCAQLIN